MQNHISAAINSIKTMTGPAEGYLMVQLDGWLYTADDAIQHIRDNPWLEFYPIEKWAL